MVALLPAGKLRFVFFPSIFSDNVTAPLELEEGLPVDELHEQTLRIAKALENVHRDFVRENGEEVVRHVQITAETNTRPRSLRT